MSSIQQEDLTVTATLRRNRFTRDRLLHEASIDSDFRAELEANPETFGATVDELDLPASVEGQDDSFLEALSDGMAGVDIFACASSCSHGPFTIICDGNTKSG